MGKQQKLEQISFLYIKDQIIQGLWLPGHHIVESNISTKLDMSRSPIRAALAVLSEEGTIEMRPYRGFYVNEKLSKDVLVPFRLRYFIICYFRLMDRIVKNRTNGRSCAEQLTVELNKLKAAFDHKNYEECAQLEMAFFKKLLSLANHQFLVDEALLCYESVVTKVHKNLSSASASTQENYQRRNIIYLEDIITLISRDKFDETRTICELLAMHQYRQLSAKEQNAFDHASPYLIK